MSSFIASVAICFSSILFIINHTVRFKNKKKKIRLTKIIVPTMILFHTSVLAPTHNRLKLERLDLFREPVVINKTCLLDMRSCCSCS